MKLEKGNKRSEKMNSRVFMRMQIYEHIYDLFPPIHTQQTVNNLFVAEEKNVKEQEERKSI